MWKWQYSSFLPACRQMPFFFFFFISWGEFREIKVSYGSTHPPSIDSRTYHCLNPKSSRYRSPIRMFCVIKGWAKSYDKSSCHSQKSRGDGIGFFFSSHLLIGHLCYLFWFTFPLFYDRFHQNLFNIGINIKRFAPLFTRTFFNSKL